MRDVEFSLGPLCTLAVRVVRVRGSGGGRGTGSVRMWVRVYGRLIG